MKIRIELVGSAKDSKKRCDFSARFRAPQLDPGG